MTTIQVRIDDHVKKSVKTILEELGLDLSAAIKMYLYQIMMERGLPFRPRLTENGLTPEEEQEILKASEEAKRGINVSGPFCTWEETKAFLDSLKKTKKNKSNDDDHLVT